MREPVGPSATNRLRLAGAAALVVALALAGCGGDPAEGSSSGDDFEPADGDPPACVGPTPGCGCDPGAPPVDCYLEPTPSPEGRICRRGTMYCRQGTWSECEAIETYTLETLPRHAGLVTGPDMCNPCNPDCATNTDRPNDADLTADNSTDVEHTTGPPSGLTLIDTGPTVADLPDADGDGVPDVADDFPGDPSRWHSEDDSGYFHLLPYGGPSEIDPLDFQTQVTTADVYFLMDTTGSMGGEIANLKNDLTSGTFVPGCPGGIIAAVQCTIPDAWFGVGRFDDYWYYPYGSSYYGDVPYEHRLDITDSVSAAQSAVNGLSTHYGRDFAESQTQALWSMATGNGLDFFLAPRGACGGDRWGYPCFRPDTIPIVVMFTDAPFHNGPYSAYDYGFCVDKNGNGYCDSGDWWPPTWTETLNALNARDIRVITVESGGSEVEANARALGNATASVDSGGSPYVFGISSSGGGLSTAVVDAIDKLANDTRFDVSARATDNPSTGIDERGFVQSINAIGWGPGDCAGKTASQFIQCTPGTIVDFRVEFRNDFVMPTMSPQVFDFYIEVLLDDSVQRRIPVRIVVPPEVPSYAPSGSYTRDYDSTTFCEVPPQRPAWGTFEWTASTPSDSGIRFTFRTAGTESDLASATPVSINVPPRSDSGSADVGALLAGAGLSAVEPYLRVTATLFASSDRTVPPTLTEFRMQYNCFAAE